MRIKMLVLAAFTLMSGAVSAQPYSGTVYGVYPEGVMVNQGGQSYLIPSQHATFKVGGARAAWSSLQPGQLVNAILPPTYYPSVQRIADPYAWKVKYHPDHPHGGPPGQLKKAGGTPGVNVNVNGGGKGKGKGKGK